MPCRTYDEAEAEAPALGVEALGVFADAEPLPGIAFDSVNVWPVALRVEREAAVVPAVPLVAVVPLVPVVPTVAF